MADEDASTRGTEGEKKNNGEIGAGVSPHFSSCMDQNTEVEAESWRDTQADIGRWPWSSSCEYEAISFSMYLAG